METDNRIKIELEKFQKLLQYFVCHLERFRSELHKWEYNVDSIHSSFETEVKKRVEDCTTKAGQGYLGGKIQEQIKGWDIYGNNKICISCQSGRGEDYTKTSNYLHWIDTGDNKINIIAIWKEPDKKLIQELYISVNDEKIKSINIAELMEKERIKLFFEKYQDECNKAKGISNNKTNRKHYEFNQILYGPPGTGKTYCTMFRALDILEVNYNPNY